MFAQSQNTYLPHIERFYVAFDRRKLTNLQRFVAWFARAFCKRELRMRYSRSTKWKGAIILRSQKLHASAAKTRRALNHNHSALVHYAENHNSV